ncbi:MAG TPA: single-stranded DNA-binding protein, partial [Chondromyces sp.]|nr:single-stranded DNA-binding protein [Chondromyces sp.]
VWRRPAENVANFLKKGSLAGVDGRIQTRNYEGQDGKRVYVTEVLAESVQFLEPRSGQGERGNDGGSYGGQRTQDSPFGQNQRNNNGNQGGYTRIDDDPFGSGGQSIDISDDDLPF